MTDKPVHRGRNKPDDLHPDGESGDDRKKDLDRELDRELRDSFPSSDPPSITQPKKNRPAGNPKVNP
jgi:hypothetical protein